MSRRDQIAATHRHFNGACTGCDWQSTDLSSSLRADHAAHVTDLRAALQPTHTDTEKSEQ